QAIHDLLHGPFVEFEHWIAIALLIAGIDQGVQRQRILIRRGDLFLDQAADDAGLQHSEFDIHQRPPPPPPPPPPPEDPPPPPPELEPGGVDEAEICCVNAVPRELPMLARFM